METNAKKVKQSLRRVRKTLSWTAMSKGARAAQNRSKSIDHQLEAEKEKKQHELLMLVLGGAGSGKSTFIKQIRLHCGDGFPEIERSKYTNQVFDNIATAANKVMENMQTFQIKFESETLQQQSEDFERRNPILNLKELLNQVSEDAEENDASPTPKGANSLIQMACSELTKRFTYLNLKCNGLSSSDQKLLLLFWEDAGFQECYSRRKTFKWDMMLSPQEIYFLGNIKRILNERYIPSLQDILYIRKPTLGIIEHQFCMDNMTYRVIDVAGQKSQRKKWIHLFENATVVLFFVALSSFDEMLEEDETLNALQDSLQMFHEVSHNMYLEKTDFLLFLNKHDLFVEKLKTTSLKSHLNGFADESTAENGVKYIRELFQQHRPCHKQVYTHVSCATDVLMMREIVSKVIDIVTEINLRKAGGAY